MLSFVFVLFSSMTRSQSHWRFPPMGDVSWRGPVLSSPSIAGIIRPLGISNTYPQRWEHFSYLFFPPMTQALSLLGSLSLNYYLHRLTKCLRCFCFSLFSFYCSTSFIFMVALFKKTTSVYSFALGILMKEEVGEVVWDVKGLCC